MATLASRSRFGNLTLMEHYLRVRMPKEESSINFSSSGTQRAVLGPEGA
jgi:hypothetical protein